MAADVETLLQPPSKDGFPTPTRTQSAYNPLRTFHLPKGEQKHYTQQFADMYFLRLAMLKPVVESVAAEAWEDFKVAGEKARRVERVLDVRQGELCWVVGTVYMEMPLKPNVLDDISKEHWIAAPPPREKYLDPSGVPQMMLEDESGRLRLTGAFLQTQMLVTGCIIAVMGTENADGAFNAIDVKIADLARQPDRWERDDGEAALAGRKVKTERPRGGKVAVISGLGITGEAGETLPLDLLAEYLLGEAGNGEEASQISRLIVAGNSFAHASPIPTRQEMAARKPSKKYGYDASSYNAAPSEQLDLLLASLLPSIPVTIMAGATDPAPVSVPQQPLHPALFPHSRAYSSPPSQKEGENEAGWFDNVTNPWEGDIDGWRFMGNSGQPIDDIFKYVPGDDRLEIMEHLLRWRNGAPTAPDTLWSYPFQDDDPFIIRDCPHVYFVGNQPRFDTAIIEGPLGQQVRIVAVPKFRETGQLLLVDSETLEVECVQFEVHGQQ